MAQPLTVPARDRTPSAPPVLSCAGADVGYVPQDAVYPDLSARPPRRRRGGHPRRSITG